MNICNCIHGAIQTPLLRETLRADCLYDRGQTGEDVNVKQRYSRDQVEVFVHRIQHYEVKIVAEIPKQNVSRRGRIEIRDQTHVQTPMKIMNKVFAVHSQPR
jgi:hypothetical protein